MRSWILSTTALLLCILGIWASACTEEDSNPQVNQLSEEESTATKSVDDILNLEIPSQVTFTWTGAVPGGGPGTVILRTNGPTRRWDSTADTRNPPNQGQFSVYRTEGGTTKVYGCLWLKAEDPDKGVRAECSEGGGGGIEIFLDVFSLTQRTARETDQRMILGSPAHCYDLSTNDELCTDQNGRLLYLSVSTAGVRDTIEAIKVEEPEPLTWPELSGSGLAPTDFDQLQSASELDLPSDFLEQ